MTSVGKPASPDTLRFESEFILFIVNINNNYTVYTGTRLSPDSTLEAQHGFMQSSSLMDVKLPRRVHVDFVELIPWNFSKIPFESVPHLFNIFKHISQMELAKHQTGFQSVCSAVFN